MFHNNIKYDILIKGKNIEISKYVLGIIEQLVAVTSTLKSYIGKYVYFIDENNYEINEFTLQINKKSVNFGNPFGTYKPVKYDAVNIKLKYNDLMIKQNSYKIKKYIMKHITSHYYNLIKDVVDTVIDLSNSRFLFDTNKYDHWDNNKKYYIGTKYKCFTDLEKQYFRIILMTHQFYTMDEQLYYLFPNSPTKYDIKPHIRIKQKEIMMGRYMYKSLKCINSVIFNLHLESPKKILDGYIYKFNSMINNMSMLYSNRHLRKNLQNIYRENINNFISSKEIDLNLEDQKKLVLSMIFDRTIKPYTKKLKPVPVPVIVESTNGRSIEKNKHNKPIMVSIVNPIKKNYFFGIKKWFLVKQKEKHIPRLNMFYRRNTFVY